MLESLISLDRQLLLWLNGSDSVYLDGLAWTLTSAVTWVPLYVALLWMVVKNNVSARQILIVVACAVMCVVMAGTLDDEIVKPLVARFRPTHDPVIGQMVDVVHGYRGGSYGFFSAHAANTMSLAVYFSLLARRRWLTWALVVWSLVNCWTRVYLGVHFPGDILCGLLWGCASGALMWWLYSLLTAHSEKKPYRKNDVLVVICTLATLFVYSLVRAFWFE